MGSNGADHARRDRESEVHDLHAKIGQLTVGIFWPNERKRMKSEIASMPPSFDQPGFLRTWR